MDKNPNESSIEDVLKELKHGVSEQEMPKELIISNAGDSELKNLKNVLLQADAQAGFSKEAADAASQQPESAEANKKNELVFNENFLKLERLIKDLKQRK